MPAILHVNASPRCAKSNSLQLARHFIDSVRAAGRANFDVEILDLFDDNALPVFGRTAAAAKIAESSGQSQTPEQVTAWESARAVFDQFAAADAYVFNIPMWNAGVPYVLKQWIDIITQPGWSFAFDPNKGYEGLIKGKQALAIHTSGIYAPGVPAAFGSDFSSTFFADWLSLVGVEDATHIRFAPTARNGDLDGTRKLAEAELAQAALGFAGKLSATTTSSSSKIRSTQTLGAG